MNHTQASTFLARANNCFYVSLDHNLSILSANEKFSNLFTPHAIEPGKPFLPLFALPLQQKWKNCFSNNTTPDRNPRAVTNAVEAGMRTLNIEWNIFDVINTENKNTGFEVLGVLLQEPAGEVTINKESELNNEKYYRSLFDYNPNSVFSLDNTGKLIKVNNAFTKLLEWTEDELHPSPLNVIFREDDIEIAKEYYHKALEGNSANYSGNLITKNGKNVDVTITFIPVKDNENTIGVNCRIENITESVVANKTLLKQEERLKSVLSKLKKVLNSSLDVICTIDRDGKFIKVSAASKKLLGYEPRELAGKHFMDFIYEEDLDRTFEANLKIQSGIATTNFENRYYRKDRSIADLVWSSRWDEGDQRYYAIARDASEKKASEAALKASEEKYKILFYNHPLPTWIYDVETFMFIEVNEAAIEHYGYSREEFLKMKLQDILVGQEVQRFENLHNQEGFHLNRHKDLWKHKKKNNEVLYAEITSNFIDYQGRKAKLVLSIDRTEHIIAEQELLKSNEKYYYLSEATFDAIWDWDIQSGDVQWNEGVKKMFEMPHLTTTTKVDWWLDNLHPDDRARVEVKLQEHIKTNNSNWEDEYRFKIDSNTYKYIFARGYIIFDAAKGPVRMIGAMQDLTERKRHENTLQKLNSSLEKRAKELAESNAELERFAYVASHDLQEPLRMVTSFLQLLEKRYKDKLDQKAHEYINYAVDGAERMKKLILDLLEYSRVNSSKIEKEDVDVNEIMNDLKITYKNILKETDGTINNSELPVVKGNKTQILQLFQNLVGNAFKYKSDEPPVINISYEEDNAAYKFAISDNGIGIDPKFFHKIFIIFQRLHNREKYSGTGIGLAICKKIIDKHGGKIWVSSTPGKGSTFYFTLPKSK